MSRNREKNEQIREDRKKQILDAALSVYIRRGYHGTDMDAVANEAGLAKGLLYYYYKTKQELFTELFIWMLNEAYTFSDTLFKSMAGLNPVEELVHYTYGLFCKNKDTLRMMQFSIRMPFDAYAVFGPEPWTEGTQKSDMHRQTLSSIIERGIADGLIPKTNPSAAANSFWSVFVANVFEYSKLITGTQKPIEVDVNILRDVVRFCFQGLGIEYSVWNSPLEKLVSEQSGGTGNEGL